MNTMKIKQIKRVGQHRFEYSYSVKGDWSKYFKLSEPMWAEYSQPVDQVPDSVAVLPLIGNVIVLASLMDADIYVEEIDKDFYECIDEFIQGFDTIMPDHVTFKRSGIVHAGKILENPLSQTEQAENLLFFSGGVDATSSLVSHIEEKPALVTIGGADIPWDNEEAWKKALHFNQEAADRHGLNLLTIRSNFRKSLNDDELDPYSKNLVNDWWWSAFHHSVAMMCLAAPVVCGKRKNIYFGSSYSSKDLKEWGSYVLASDPQIDNHVRFCGSQVIHDGYEFSRYDKIKNICSYYGHQAIKPYLRVCYLSNTGKNCGTCEKCASAIMSIRLAGHNPEDYGFQYQAQTLPTYFAAGMQEMARAGKYDFLSLYKDVQSAYRNKFSIDEVPPVLRTFYETDLETLADFLLVPNNECLEMEKRIKNRQDKLLRQYGQQTAEADAVSAGLLAETLDELNSMKASTSWKITKPLRTLADWVRKVRP